jgi:hypothetical protein
MARGWKSKSVTDQIVSASERAVAEPGIPLTTQQMENRQRVQSLKHSLAYIDQQISESQSERHKTQLGHARVDLVKQLDELQR